MSVFFLRNIWCHLHYEWYYNTSKILLNSLFTLKIDKTQYMIIMSLLFILLLAFSVAALAVTEDQRIQLIRKAWKADKDQVKVVEKNFNCCGLTEQLAEDKCPSTVVSLMYFS